MKSITAEWTTEIGSLSTAIIIDMWESAGISEPRTLLQDLGFYGLEVQVTELIAALEDEQQRLGDGNDTSVVVRVSWICFLGFVCFWGAG